MSVKNPFSYSENLNLYKCRECGTCFFEPFEYPSYSDDYKYENYAKFYVEQGAGIDFMIKPLLFLSNLRNYSSILDVGCGFGFLVKFAEEILHMEAIGVDPSRYCKEGQKILNINTYNNYLEYVNELKGKNYDIVYSSEVIEHIMDPSNFVKLLKNYLHENGVLILTTPNAEFINCQTPVSTLMEILLPGFHHILFSPFSIQMLLTGLGFKSIEVMKEAHRLIVFASKERNKKLIAYTEDKDLRDKYYIQYLEKLSQISHPWLKLGVMHRLFKEIVNKLSLIHI